MKYLLIIVFLSLSTGFSQTSPDIIYWTENSRLEWKDFKGPPENHPTHKAMTRSGSAIGIDIDKDSLAVTIKSTFDRTKSWVKSGWDNAPTLEHEQIHFDIREVLARRIKKAVLEKGKFKRKTVERDVTNIIQNQTAQYNKDQISYDQDSYTSIDKQKQWKTKVELELNSLSAFKNPTVKAPIID